MALAYPRTRVAYARMRSGNATTTMQRAAILAVVAFVLGVCSVSSAQTAPGAPGDPAIWTPADKDGFGTANTTASKVWHPLERGRLTEVYYPDLGTPSVRT